MNDRLLTDAQKAQLRSLGQTVDVALEVGEGGLTPEFYAKLDQHFKLRELVKVRFLGADRPTRSGLIAHIAKNGFCQFGGATGNIGLFYRPNPLPAARVIKLPSA